MWYFGGVQLLKAFNSPASVREALPGLKPYTKAGWKVGIDFEICIFFRNEMSRDTEVRWMEETKMGAKKYVPEGRITAFTETSQNFKRNCMLLKNEGAW